MYSSSVALPKSFAARVAFSYTDLESFTDDHIKESPESLEGVHQSQISDPQRPQTVELAKIYKDKFGRELSMTWYVATGYDAIRLYVHAIGNVGVDSIAIKNFLYTVKNFLGASQDIEISAGGSFPYFSRRSVILESLRSLLR